MFLHLWLRKGTFPVCNMNRYNGRHTGDLLPIDDDDDDDEGNELITCIPVHGPCTMCCGAEPVGACNLIDSMYIVDTRNQL